MMTNSEILKMTYRQLLRYIVESINVMPIDKEIVDKKCAILEKVTENIVSIDKFQDLRALKNLSKELHDAVKHFESTLQNLDILFNEIEKRDETARRIEKQNDEREFLR
jgi:hypothetical protein